MATNRFFNHYNNAAEQNLLDSLIVESIQIAGVDMVYVAKEIVDENRILNEDPTDIYDQAFDIEMYPKTFESYGDQGDFMSKFGLQIRDSATFVVAKTTFRNLVTEHRPSLVRPLEGDLLYFPLADNLMKIMHVEHESIFYQSGTLPVYELKVELLEFNHQRIETGDPRIDRIYEGVIPEPNEVEDLFDLKEWDEMAKNLDIKEKSDDIIDFSQLDPFTKLPGRL